MLKSEFKSKLSILIRAASRRTWHAVMMLMLAGVPVHAQDYLLAQQDVDNPVAEEVTQVSQRQALELVRARFPGNVISINEIQQQGQRLYRIRLDNDGNIYTVYVNAMTGAITREQ